MDQTVGCWPLTTEARARNRMEQGPPGIRQICRGAVAKATGGVTVVPSEATQHRLLLSPHREALLLTNDPETCQWELVFGYRGNTIVFFFFTYWGPVEDCFVSHAPLLIGCVGFFQALITSVRN
jgi:hypothetical protein